MLSNFEGHKDTEITLDKGLNMVTGTSDAGKSSVVRAIKWVAENKPSGDSFRSHWGGNTSVAVVFNTGDCVERTKTNNENLYLVNGTEYKGFGTRVPGPVKKMFGFSDLSIQNQHDPHFMLTISSGKRIEKLNETVDLELIDKASKISRKKLRDSKRKKDELEEEIENIDSRLSGFAPVEKAMSLTNEARRSDTVATSAGRKIDELEEYVESFNKINKVFGKIERVVNNTTKTTDKIKEKMKMVSLTVTKIHGLEDIVDKAENIDTSLEEYDSDVVEKIVSKYNKLHQKMKEREHTLDEVEKLTKKSFDYEHKLNKLDDEIEEIEEEIGGLSVCPFCGSQLRSGNE